MSLMIATPVRGAELWSTSVTVGYSECVRALSREMPVDTISATLTYSCDNIRARNRVAATVLREPAFRHITHVLWWDDDQWPEDRRIVKEMMDTGEDVLAAPYTNKKQPLHWVHQLLPEKPDIDPRGLLEVSRVGFGFTMTSRACLQRMSDAARKYTDIPNPHRVANIFGQLYERLTPGNDQEEECLLSEDYSFCKRWRDMGGKIQLFTRAGIIFHAGSHAWSAREKEGAVLPIPRVEGGIVQAQGSPK